MSGPYRFPPERVTSPLDQRPVNPFPSGQPPSFKTNINRNKTKKWVEAKPYSYDGDDWGDYDEDDEYGVSAHTSKAPQVPTGLKQRGQSIEKASRSFTDPQPGAERRNSFEFGDDKRAFSSSMGPMDALPPIDTSVQGGSSAGKNPESNVSPNKAPMSPHQGAPRGLGEPALAQSRGSILSWGAPSLKSDSSAFQDPHTRRDFEHSALPPPLQMRSATAPTSAPDTPLGHRPRTGSLAPETAMPSAVSQDSTPIAERQRAPSNPNKALPFVRPADIYKRAVDTGGHAGAESKSPAAEAKPQHEHLPGFEVTKPPGQPAGGSGGGVASPSLPPLHSGSTFGDEFWDSTQGLGKSGGESGARQPQSELQHQTSSGFRSAVRAAFERKDDNSVPPTPISKSNSLSTSGCNVSRSNTDSTTGISPIMSGVPGGGLPSLRTDTSTPAIAEEPSPSPRSASGTIQPLDPSQKPSTSHSRNPSGGTLPGASTPTGRPSSNHSPARSPAIEPARPVAAPATAEMSADYGAREVDLASPPSKSSKSNSGLEELQAQATFLDSHRSPGPESPERSSPISRSESPTKGRVRDLAGKLNEQIADSRRNSTQSISSQKSHDSGKKSSRPSSPTKSAAAERPQAEREISFRPKIPGTWESHNTTPGQSSPEKEKPEPLMQMSRKTTAESFDIAPTTAKQQLDYKEPVDPIKNPTGALAATGAALGESIRSALSPGERSAESSSEDLSKTEDDRQARGVGDVWLRPLHVDRTNTSTTAQTDMTLQSKESHLGDSPIEQPLPLRSSRSPSTQPEARTPLPRSKTIKDVESEALEQEIMKRLSNPSPGSLNVEPFNRAGSGLSQELEKNWTSGGEDDVQSLHTGLSVHDATIRPVEPSPFSSPERDEPGRPSLLTKRFSWEQSSAGNSTPAHQTPSKLLDSRENLAAKSIDDLSGDAGRSSEGLQLVNPEPESSPSPEPVELAAPAAPNQPLDADAWRAQSTAVDPAATLGERSTSASQTLALTRGGEQSRIPLFREILALKSSQERISKFNQTRESFASMDTGLRAWVAMTLEKKPEHAELADLPRNPPKPMSADSGSIRGHKHGASLSHIATGLRKSSQTVTSESATTGAHPGASGAAGSSASGSGANRERMQAKGKDLLKGAGVLGGKGMKEAKGLFAKGRSRFGRNESKAQRSASNANPSHAPSTITTAPASRKSSLFSPSAQPSRPVSSHSPLPPVVGRSESIAIGDSSRVLSPSGEGPLSDDEDEPKQDKKKRKRFSAAISRIAHGRSGSRPASMFAEGPTVDKGKRVASPLSSIDAAQIRPVSVALDGLTQEPLANGVAEDLQHDVKKDDGADKSKGKRHITEPENGLDSVLNGDPKPPAASPGPPEADRARSLSSMDSEEDPFARIPSQPMSIRDKSRSRGASAYTSPAASRPVSGSAFVPPEEWDTLPTLWTGGRATPNERTPQTDRHMLPSQRSLERLRRNSSPQVLQNLRSSSLLSSKRSLAELPETPEREPSDQLIERLGVLPSPSIEPMNWPEEKQRRKTVGADQRLERVVESVVRHSASLSSRELKGERVARKPSKLQDDVKGEAAGTPTLQPGFQEEKPVGTRSGALSSRPSFVRDRRSTPSLRAAQSRGSIRTRGSKASISSLLPIPLDEVARRSMARDEGEGAEEEAEITTSGKMTDESVNEIAETREQPARILQEKTVSPVRSVSSSAPDASAGAPLSPGLSFHTAASEHEDEPFEMPLEKDPSPEVSEKESAASPIKKFAVAVDEQAADVSTSGPSPQPDQGEWLVPRTRKQRNDPRQGPLGFTSPVPGLANANSSHARFQKSAPGVVEYRASQGEPPMPQRFMSPPPGLVEYGTQQGRRGAPQAFQPFVEDRSSTTQEIAKEFDPRAYTPEFTLPGVGPPDLSRSDTKRKSFLGVGIPGSKHSTPPSGSSVERVNERINPRDLDLTQRKFSYQSSNDERRETDATPSEPPVRRGSRGFLPFRRTSVANDSTIESQTTSRSGSGFGAAVASLAPPPAASPTPMSGRSVGPSPNKKGRNVLQRNHSVAVTPAPEPKEKTKRRGSIFGSLFGRSASTSQAKEKGEKKSRRAEGKRLSKMPAVTETRIDGPLNDGVLSSQGQPYEAVPEIPLHLQPSSESQSRIYYKEPSLPNVNPLDLHRHRGLKTPPPPPPPQNYYIPSGPENQPPTEAAQQVPQPPRNRYYQPQGPLNQTTPPRPQQSRFPSQPGPINGPTVAPTQPHIARQSTMPEFSNFAGMHTSPPDSRIASPPTRESSRSRGPDPVLPTASCMPSRPNSAGGQGYSRPQSKTPPIPRPDPFTAQRVFYEQQRKQQQQSNQDDASRNGSIIEATHYVPGPPTFDNNSSRMKHYAPTPPPPEAALQHQQRPYQISLPPNPPPESRPRSNPRYEPPESIRPVARPEPRWREASPQEIQQFQQKQMQLHLSSERQYETPYYAPVRPSSRGGPMSWAADPYHRRGSAPPIAYAPPPPRNGPPPPQMHLPPPARSYTDQAIHQTYGTSMAPQNRHRSSSGSRPGPEAYMPYRGSAVYDFPDDDATYNDGNFENKRDSRGRWPGFANAEAQAQAEAYADARMSAVRAQSRSRSRSASQSRGSRSRSRGRPVGAGNGGRSRGLSQGSVPAAAPNGIAEKNAGPEGRKSLGHGEEPVRMLGSSYPGMEWHPGIGWDGQ